MEINLMDYVMDQALILMPVLYILGLMLKQSKFIKDWCIPWILLLAGIVGSISIIGPTNTAVIQGILVTGATVFGNQLVKQTLVKSKYKQD